MPWQEKVWEGQGLGAGGEVDGVSGAPLALDAITETGDSRKLGGEESRFRANPNHRTNSSL